MFWRFGFTTSTLDALLDKDDVTLEELLDSEELLQECKAQNPKLIEFLTRPQVCATLLDYVVATTAATTSASASTAAAVTATAKKPSDRYGVIACEVLCCELSAVCDVIVGNTDLLSNFWKFLDRPAPLKPLEASYFGRVNNVLLSKKPGDMVNFVMNIPDMVQKILAHIATSAVADLLLKIISIEELPEGRGIVLWLQRQNLVKHLVTQLDPSLDPDRHTIASQTLMDVIAVSHQSIAAPDLLSAERPAGDNLLYDEMKSRQVMSQLVDYMLDKSAPHATSTLINGIMIIIELIRRYCSEIEHAEYQLHQQQQQHYQTVDSLIPSEAKLAALATDLCDLLAVINSRLKEFSALLERPRSIDVEVPSSGKEPPLGFERWKICELVAELLHLQYLYSSSPLFDRLVPSTHHRNSVVTAPVQKEVANSEAPSGTESSSEVGSNEPGRGSRGGSKTVCDELVSLTHQLVSCGTLPICLQLFFRYPWNNMLHSVVYDMIAKVFNTYSFASSTTAGLQSSAEGTAAAAKDPLSAEQRMIRVKDAVYLLVISILRDGRLTNQIIEAQTKNDCGEFLPRGSRLGYMGHLTYISDEVCKLFDKCAADFDEEVNGLVKSLEWQGYILDVLAVTKERDSQTLGGEKPAHAENSLNTSLAAGIGGFGGPSNIDDADIGISNIALHRAFDEEDHGGVNKANTSAFTTSTSSTTADRNYGTSTEIDGWPGENNFD